MRIQTDAYPVTEFGKVVINMPFVFVAELEFPELWRTGTGPWVRIGPGQYIHIRDRQGKGAIRMFQPTSDRVRVRPIKIHY